MREFIHPELFLKVLEAAKNLKTEYVLIPRMINQTQFKHTIAGISYDAIIVTSLFDEFRMADFVLTSLWNEASLDWICLPTKEINQFIQTHAKLMGDSTKKITPIEELELRYTTYDIGNKLSVAYQIREPIEGVPDSDLPTFHLISPFLYLPKFENMFYAIQDGAIVWKDKQIDQDEEFKEIINSKAGDGASIWIPKITNTEIDAQYAMTLTGTMLNVAKDDQVFCTIRENISGKTGYHFVVQFDVYKPKKKCKLTYYLMMLKVGQ